MIPPLNALSNTALFTYFLSLSLSHSLYRSTYRRGRCKLLFPLYLNYAVSTYQQDLKLKDKQNFIHHQTKPELSSFIGVALLVNGQWIIILILVARDDE